MRRLAFLMASTAFTLATYGASAPSSSEDESEKPASIENPKQDSPETEPLIYSVNRAPERPFDTSRAAQVITSEDIWRKNPRNLPELLMEEAGVFIQQTNYGGGSPILRGLMGKQILILFDGIRFNNATYRFGPLQYLNTIDIDMIERIEIVRGVGSVVGSDTLGGIINIIPKKGPSGRDGNGFSSSLFSRYSTADNAVTGFGQLQGRGASYRFHLGVGLRDTGELTAGEGELQPWTGYDEKSVALNFDHFVTDDRTLTLSYHGLDQNGVTRSDRIANGQNEVFEFEPQRMQLLRVSYEDLAPPIWGDHWQITGYWNHQEEGRREIRISAPEIERSLEDSQQMFGFKWEAGNYFGENHRLLYGVDASTEKIHSQRLDRILETGESRPRRGNYTDGSSYRSLAAYVQDRIELTDRFTLSLGVRSSHFHAAGTEETTVGALDLDSKISGLTGSAHLVFHWNNNINLVANVIRGFRAPNIDDISIFDERSNGTEIPNANLEAERITSYEVGAKFSNSRSSGAFFYHCGNLTDLLVRTEGTVNGLPFFDFDGDGIQGTDEPNVLTKQNLGQSRIHGIEASGDYRLPGDVLVFGNLTQTRGTNQLSRDPLRRIPPTFGTVGVRWSARSPRRPWTEFRFHFAAAQTRLSDGDIADSRIGPEGTPSFEVFHLRGGFSVSDKLRVTASIENLFDKHYKYHGSGIFRPGRQLVVGAQLSN